MNIQVGELPEQFSSAWWNYLNADIQKRHATRTGYCAPPSQTRFARRLHTTLAHELAHVVLHNFIWWFEPGVAFDPMALSPRCALRARAVDWMEWQANYCAGALLVPASALDRPSEPVWERSTSGRSLIRAVQARFDVSAQAATIRLYQLGHLSKRPLRVVRSPVPRL